MKLLLVVILLPPVLANQSLWNGSAEATKRYKPEWSDLDTRPLPQWYDAAKIGIYLHWGVSVPTYTPDVFWKEFQSGNESITKFIQKKYPPGYIYQDFGPMITAEFFDPQQWAQLLQKSGAKYVILTTKNFEGFTLFPSNTSFVKNSVDSGPHIDIVGQLSKAVREQGLVFGVYYSLYERFNPLYWADFDKNFSTCVYPVKKVLPEIKQLVHNYKPSVIWSDGDWGNTDTYWNSKELLAWLYNDSPVKDGVVVNDRWGIGTPCNHGDFYNCENRYKPNVLQKNKWEGVFTLDKHSWNYRTNIENNDILSKRELIETVVFTVSRGGNALISVGPTKEGTIAQIFQERLLNLGEWLKINGEAIYRTSPWLYQNDTSNGAVWYTCTKTKYNARSPTAVPNQNDTLRAIYAIFLEWPKDSVLILGAITPLLRSGNYQVELLGRAKSFYQSSYLGWTITDGNASIYLPSHAQVLSSSGWTLRFTVIDYRKVILRIMIAITITIVMIVIAIIIMKSYKCGTTNLRAYQPASLQPDEQT